MKTYLSYGCVILIDPDFIVIKVIASCNFEYLSESFWRGLEDSWLRASPLDGSRDHIFCPDVAVLKALRKTVVRSAQGLGSCWDGHLDAWFYLDLVLAYVCKYNWFNITHTHLARQSYLTFERTILLGLVFFPLGLVAVRNCPFFCKAILLRFTYLDAIGECWCVRDSWERWACCGSTRGATAYQRRGGSGLTAWWPDAFGNGCSPSCDVVCTRELRLEVLVAKVPVEECGLIKGEEWHGEHQQVSSEKGKTRTQLPSSSYCLQASDGER